jgi:ABC-type maltose transport system permease subunit
MKNIYILLIIIIVIIIIIIIYSTNKNEEKKCIIKKVYYFPDVLSQEEYKKILEECKILKPYLKEDDLKMIKRKTIVIDKNSYVNSIFYGNKFLNYLYKIVGFRVKASNNLPIEFRIYEKGGKMDWHRDYVDKVVRNCPQIEIVFTLENSSDSKTVWIDDDTNKKNEIITKNNSIIITQGNGAYHMVTPVSTGYRSIIKIAYDIL